MDQGLPCLDFFGQVDEEIRSKTFVLFCRNEMVESDEADFKNFGFRGVKSRQKYLENSGIVFLEIVPTG